MPPTSLKGWRILDGNSRSHNSKKRPQASNDAKGDIQKLLNVIVRPFSLQGFIVLPACIQSICVFGCNFYQLFTTQTHCLGLRRVWYVVKLRRLQHQPSAEHFKVSALEVLGQVQHRLLFGRAQAAQQQGRHFETSRGGLQLSQSFKTQIHLWQVRHQGTAMPCRRQDVNVRMLGCIAIRGARHDLRGVRRWKVQAMNSALTFATFAAALGAFPTRPAFAMTFVTFHMGRQLKSPV
mmetsp:Transcript_1204/g.2701  ORF Transcript_1204/g.2701 Transcript_1204/m.2701 type:complete len:236 (+) Transcript_1204:846-1553(+)